MQKSRTWAVIVGIPLVAISCLAVFACWSPNSRFLVPQAGAEWIIYPVPPRSNVNDAIEQHALFSRQFELAHRLTAQIENVHYRHRSLTS